MRVSELMSRATVTVAPEDSVACAARLMDRHSVGALPVCSQDGRLRGIVTDRDIFLAINMQRRLYGDPSAKTLESS